MSGSNVPWATLTERTMRAICRDLGLDHSALSKQELASLLHDVEVGGLDGVLRRSRTSRSREQRAKPVAEPRVLRPRDRPGIQKHAGPSRTRLVPFVDIPPLPEPKQKNSPTKVVLDGVLMPPLATAYSTPTKHRGGGGKLVFDCVELPPSPLVANKSQRSPRKS